jgi:hypothetical protein
MKRTAGTGDYVARALAAAFAVALFGVGAWSAAAVSAAPAVAISLPTVQFGPPWG